MPVSYSVLEIGHLSSGCLISRTATSFLPQGWRGAGMVHGSPVRLFGLWNGIRQSHERPEEWPRPTLYTALGVPVRLRWVQLCKKLGAPFASNLQATKETVWRNQSVFAHLTPPACLRLVPCRDSLTATATTTTAPDSVRFAHYVPPQRQTCQARKQAKRRFCYTIVTRLTPLLCPAPPVQDCNDCVTSCLRGLTCRCQETRQ